MSELHESCLAVDEKLATTTRELEAAKAQIAKLLDVSGQSWNCTHKPNPCPSNCICYCSGCTIERVVAEREAAKAQVAELTRWKREANVALDSLATAVEALEWYASLVTTGGKQHELAGTAKTALARIRAGEGGGDVSEPIPIRLLCPMCGELHVDSGEFATKPHHTHACQECGHVWRPALVNTVGVRFLPGFKDPPEPNLECTGDLNELDCPAHGPNCPVHGRAASKETP